MKAIGLVFLYDRTLGEPEKVSKGFSEHFPNVTENLVKQGIMGLPDLKEIMEEKKIYWGGVKQNFKEVLEDDEAIGKLAWQVFKGHSGIEPSEEVKSLVYDGSKSPWGYDIMACVLYE